LLVIVIAMELKRLWLSANSWVIGKKAWIFSSWFKRGVEGVEEYPFRFIEKGGGGFNFKKNS